MTFLIRKFKFFISTIRKNKYILKIKGCFDIIELASKIFKSSIVIYIDIEIIKKIKEENKFDNFNIL
jgi:hypothetical protein